MYNLVNNPNIQQLLYPHFSKTVSAQCDIHLMDEWMDIATVFAHVREVCVHIEMNGSSA